MLTPTEKLRPEAHKHSWLRWSAQPLRPRRKHQLYFVLSVVAAIVTPFMPEILVINLVALQRNFKISRTYRASTMLRFVYDLSAVVTLLLPMRWYLPTRRGLKSTSILRKLVPLAFIVILCGFSRLSYGSSCLHLFPLWTWSADTYHCLCSHSQPVFTHYCNNFLTAVLASIHHWNNLCKMQV